MSSHCKMEITKPEEPASYVGLDVAKELLDYTVDGVKVRSVKNNLTGYRQIEREVRRLRHPRVVCEASGGYERQVVAHLLTGGIEVCVVQPGRVRSFAHAEGLLAKTDAIDACLLRRYGEKIQPRLAVAATPAASVLRELLEHRRQLSDQQVATRSRMELAQPTLRRLLEQQLQFLDEQLEKVDELIEQHIDSDNDLRGKSERMRQLKGVGPILAATLLAYVPELGQIDDAQLSALVGVAPFARDSGASRRPRHIRGGRSAVRHVLYMAAVSAIRHNRILAAFYQRLHAVGKPPMVCVVAVMRKMLLVINRLISDPQFALA